MKSNSEVKNDEFNMESEKSQSEESVKSEEEEDDVVDLDFEVEQNVVEEKKAEKNEEIAPILENNLMNSGLNTQKNNNKSKKIAKLFTPQNTSSIGRLFINTNPNTVLNTEDNVNTHMNYIKTDQNPKTVLSKVKFLLN